MKGLAISSIVEEMGGVVPCTNSDYKLKPLKNEICPTHQCERRYCYCGIPFRLWWFPSKLRNSEKRQRWVWVMKRMNEDKSKWEPADSDRVCSEHFVDREPTAANPDPTLNLGYHVMAVKLRPVVQRDTTLPN